MAHAMELNYSPALFKRLLEQDKELVEGEGPRQAHSLEARGLPRVQIRTTGSAGKSQPVGEGRARRLRPPTGAEAVRVRAGAAGAARARLARWSGAVDPGSAPSLALPRSIPGHAPGAQPPAGMKCSPSARRPHRCSRNTQTVFVNRGTTRRWQCLCSHLLQTPSCHCQDLLDVKLSCQRVENTHSVANSPPGSAGRRQLWVPGRAGARQCGHPQS